MSVRGPNKSPLLYTLNNFNPLVQPYFRKHITAILELSTKVGSTSVSSTGSSSSSSSTSGADSGETAKSPATTVCGNAALPPEAVAKSFFHGRPGKPVNSNAPTNMLSYLAEVGWEWFETPKANNLKGEKAPQSVDLGLELQAVFLRDVEHVLGLENPDVPSQDAADAKKDTWTSAHPELRTSAHPHFASLLKREQASGYTKDYAVYFAEARWKHLQEQTAMQLETNKKPKLEELLAMEEAKRVKLAAEEKKKPASDKPATGNGKEVAESADANADAESEATKSGVKSAAEIEKDLNQKHNEILKWMKGERKTFLSQVKSEPTTALQLMTIVVGGRVAQDSGTLAVQLTNNSVTGYRADSSNPASTETLFSTPTTEIEALRRQRFQDYQRYAHYADSHVWRLKAAWYMAYITTFVAWLSLSLYFEVMEHQKNAVRWVGSCFKALFDMMHGH